MQDTPPHSARGGYASRGATIGYFSNDVGRSPGRLRRRGWCDCTVSRQIRKFPDRSRVFRGVLLGRGPALDAVGFARLGDLTDLGAEMGIPTDQV